MPTKSASKNTIVYPTHKIIVNVPMLNSKLQITLDQLRSQLQNDLNNLDPRAQFNYLMGRDIDGEIFRFVNPRGLEWTFSTSAELALMGCTIVDNAIVYKKHMVVLDKELAKEMPDYLDEMAIQLSSEVAGAPGMAKHWAALADGNNDGSWTITDRDGNQRYPRVRSTTPPPAAAPVEGVVVASPAPTKVLTKAPAKAAVVQTNKVALQASEQAQRSALEIISYNVHSLHITVGPKGTTWFTTRRHSQRGDLYVYPKDVSTIPLPHLHIPKTLAAIFDKNNYRLVGVKGASPAKTLKVYAQPTGGRRVWGEFIWRDATENEVKAFCTKWVKAYQAAADIRTKGLTRRVKSLMHAVEDANRDATAALQRAAHFTSQLEKVKGLLLKNV